jgi:molybdate-binding protein
VEPEAAAAGLGLPDLVLISWAARRQGLVLPPGNPAGVRSLADVAGRGLTLARRQDDAGAQVLLRHLLGEVGLGQADVRWTPDVCRTETDLAGAVLEGQADGGLAVEAVARRLRLDFVPLVEERFDLAMRRRDYFEMPVQSLLAFAATPRLVERAAALGGYALTDLGRPRFNA